MSVTDELSKYALDVHYDRLPSEVVQRAKRILIDTLGSLVGGIFSETGKACRNVAVKMGGPAQATILGTGERVSCSSAILANQAMLRYLDCNDCINIYRGPGDLVSSHPSGCLPVAFAVGEWVGASGKQIIEAAVAGYEVIGRLLDAMDISLEVRGFHHSAVAAYAGAAMAGRMLGLTQHQVKNAMGIAGSMSLSMNILDTDGEENVMARNIVDGLSADRGLLAAHLAKEGLTGPDHVVEGHKGFAEIVLGGRERFKKKGPTDKFFILDTEIKGIYADSTTFGYVSAAAAIAKEHKLGPDDIKSVHVRANRRSVIHCGDPIKKYPRNKETADHSAYFLIAMGIMEGRVTPRVFQYEKYTDPRVITLIDKITLEADPEFDLIAPAAEVSITTATGKTYRKRIDRHELKGLPENPMTDEDIRNKFLECAEGVMSESQVDRIIDACWNLDKLDRFSDLIPLLQIDKRPPGN